MLKFCSLSFVLIDAPKVNESFNFKASILPVDSIVGSSRTMAHTAHRRLLWTPQNPGRTETDRFIRFIAQRHGLLLKGYQELHAYSVDKRTASDFWVDLFLFMNLKSDVPPRIGYVANVSSLLFISLRVETPLSNNKQRDGSFFPPLEFFPEVRLNFAQNLLMGQEHDAIAIHTCNEGGINLADVTWGRLYALVEQAADAMVASGVHLGDRVAAVISNRLETVVLCLAALSIGALWSTSSPDMGEQGILDRLLQIRPKLVFGESAVLYNGKLRGLLLKHTGCATRLTETPEYQNYVVIPTEGFPVTQKPEAKLTSWSGFLGRGTGRRLTFAQLPFSHPGFIVYSSGTVSGAV